MKSLMIAGILGSMVMVPSCSVFRDPCPGALPKASASAVALVRQGYEVERELHSGVDCELLIDGRWQKETE